MQDIWYATLVKNHLTTKGVDTYRVRTTVLDNYRFLIKGVARNPNTRFMYGTSVCIQALSTHRADSVASIMDKVHTGTLEGHVRGPKPERQSLGEGTEVD